MVFFLGPVLSTIRTKYGDLRDLPYLIQTPENTEPKKNLALPVKCDTHEDLILENISIFLINFDIHNIFTE